MTKQKIDKNYLDYIPVKNPDIEYEKNEKGIITVFIRWYGFFFRLFPLMNQIVIYLSVFFCFCYHFLTFHVRKERVKKLSGIGDTDALFAKRLLSGETLYTVGEFFFRHLPITF